MTVLREPRTPKRQPRTERCEYCGLEVPERYVWRHRLVNHRDEPAEGPAT